MKKEKKIKKNEKEKIKKDVKMKEKLLLMLFAHHSNEKKIKNEKKK